MYIKFKKLKKKLSTTYLPVQERLKCKSICIIIPCIMLNFSTWELIKLFLLSNYQLFETIVN